MPSPSPRSGDPSATGGPSDVRARATAAPAFRVLGPGIEFATGCAIPGRYNVANALLALAMLHEDGIARR